MCSGTGLLCCCISEDVARSANRRCAEFDLCKKKRSDAMLTFLDASRFNYTKTCLTANNNDDTKSFDRTKQVVGWLYPS
jgi:hypothetical protein